MATKRRTDHESTQKPDGPAVEAASADQPVSGGSQDDPKVKQPAADAGATDRKEDEKAEAEGARGETAPADQAPAGDRRAEELASQLEEANGRHLRLAADFENYKKRVRQEQMDTMKYAAATVAERLLPVLDDADRALSHAPEGVDEGWLKGVRLTFQKLEEVLGSVGVERIESLGAPFDPKQHEAVASEETAKHPEDTVVAELRAGYRMHDRVLRPALVKVARPPA
ncbi:MAG: nucleotide exchange factor GrpE [Chloroflexi bacterium]|nr:MAG: nucleotide exchange factor GrpE [Chloroflexota bacterium]